MPSALDRIVASKRAEIEASRQTTSEQQLEQQLATAPPVRDFLAALQRPGMQLIAEVKKASPSAGAIRQLADVAQVARAYERAGAACISVLTDGPFFQGSLDDLARVRQAVNVPLLRKDFILERRQVLEARVAGADAVLLIAEILDDRTLSHLLETTRAHGMEALVELYEPGNLSRVLAAGATVVGINNRDLHTFEVSLDHTLKLAADVPRECVLVSESGIQNQADVQRLEAAGVKAILVGEALMRAADPAAKIRELLAR